MNSALESMDVEKISQTMSQVTVDTAAAAAAAATAAITTSIVAPPAHRRTDALTHRSTNPPTRQLQFEAEFENMDVVTGTMQSTMDSATSSQMPGDQVDDLIKQVADQHNLEGRNLPATPPAPTDPHRPPPALNTEQPSDVPSGCNAGRCGECWCWNSGHAANSRAKGRPRGDDVSSHPLGTWLMRPPAQVRTSVLQRAWCIFYVLFGVGAYLCAAGVYICALLRTL